MGRGGEICFSGGPFGGPIVPGAPIQTNLVPSSQGGHKELSAEVLEKRRRRKQERDRKKRKRKELREKAKAAQVAAKESEPPPPSEVPSQEAQGSSGLLFNKVRLGLEQQHSEEGVCKWPTWV